MNQIKLFSIKKGKGIVNLISNESNDRVNLLCPGGYVLILVLLIVFVLSLSLLVAVPVLETEMKREKEEELIFRGKQYVEAIRLYQQKKPGSYPSSLEELVKQKCLRKLYPDPMSATGEWNLLLLPPVTISASAQAAPTQTTTARRLLVVTPEGLKKIRNPQIVGVVSSSREKSIKIYNGEEYYHLWLFYYGEAPGQKPELIYQTGQ